MKTANQLQQFREQCEKDAGVPSAAIHVPPLSVLVDVCRVLKLSKKQTQKVIGKQGSFKHSKKISLHHPLDPLFTNLVHELTNND